MELLDARAWPRRLSTSAAREFNRLAVLPPDMLPERQPDYVLLLTWNFAVEVLTQQREFRRLGQVHRAGPRGQGGLSCMRQREHHCAMMARRPLAPIF